MDSGRVSSGIRVVLPESIVRRRDDSDVIVISDTDDGGDNHYTAARPANRAPANQSPLQGTTRSYFVPRSASQSNSRLKSPSATGPVTSTGFLNSSPTVTMLRQNRDKRPLDHVRDTASATSGSPTSQRRQAALTPQTSQSSRTTTTSPAAKQRSRNALEPGTSKSRQHATTASPSNPPPSPVVARAHVTPKQTPRKPDWSAEKIAEKLRELETSLEYQHGIMTYRALRSTPQNLRDWRVAEGEDLFAAVKLDPEPEEGSLTVRAKFKQYPASTRRPHSSVGKRNITLPVNALETNVDRVPPYRFHHVEISRNILTPDAPLRYVPHVRDLHGHEERQYNQWIQSLEDMDKKGGFDPKTRREKAAETRRNEVIARLDAILPSWLRTLGIDGLNKPNLISYMMNHEPDDTITPQQKSSILDTLRRGGQVESTRAVMAARRFTEAFNTVFSDNRQESPVSLRDILFKDKDVESIVDAKRTTKDIQRTDEPTKTYETVEDGYLETHQDLACLICFCYSCDHGEFHEKANRNTWAMHIYGGVDGALKRRALRSSDSRATEEEKALYANACGVDCFREMGSAERLSDEKPWTGGELKAARALVETTPTGPSYRPPECIISAFLQRPCWQVHRKIKDAQFSPLVVEMPPLPQQPVKSLTWYDRNKKALLGDWYDHTRAIEPTTREITEACTHDGPCTAAKGCKCVIAGRLCGRFCTCTAATCPYKFTGCACHSLGKTCHSKHCVCVNLHRECDPELCLGCGALERADPANKDDDELHATGCQNCVLQRGKFKALVLGKTPLLCGYGLMAAEDISQDEFIIEYAGEIIQHDEGVRREARRGTMFTADSDVSYLFTLLEKEGFWVDAMIYGNISRYINHAGEKQVNARPVVMYANGEWRIKFVASRDIKIGDELFFDYGQNFPNLTANMLEDNKSSDGQAAARGGGSKGGQRRAAGKSASGNNSATAKRRNGTARGGRKQTAAAIMATVDESEETLSVWDVQETNGSSYEPTKPQKRKRTRAPVVEDVADEDNSEAEGSPAESEHAGGARRQRQLRRETRAAKRVKVATPRRQEEEENESDENEQGEGPEADEDEEVLAAQGPPNRAPFTRTRSRARRGGRSRARADPDQLTADAEESDGDDSEDDVGRWAPRARRTRTTVIRDSDGEEDDDDDNKDGEERASEDDVIPQSRPLGTRKTHIPARYRDSDMSHVSR